VAPVSDRRYPHPLAQRRSTVPIKDESGRPSSAAVPLLRVRLNADNPNHHLWNNHGTWFLHYTVHPTPFTKERVRRSLGTPSLAVARARRDACFAHWEIQARAAPLQAVA
jgi:hypothetical protein